MAIPRLGNGENVAYIYSRTGQQRISGDALVCSSIGWNRALCKPSAATLTLTPSACSGITRNLGVWGHSVVIYRDGDRVWEGPITRTEDTAAGLIVTAGDVLAWTGRRRIRNTRAEAASPVVTEMEWSVGAAFAPDDPNITPYVTTIGGDGPTISRDVAVDGRYHLDDLNDLVKYGGQFTVIGRRIMLWHAATAISRTLTLVPEEHLLSNVAVVQDGQDLATAVWAADDSGNATSVGGVATFYGLVESTLSLPDEQTPATVLTAAQSTYDQMSVAPVALEVPAGAALSCDAPFPMAQLVPGTLVPVETTTATGKTVSATMVLSNVAVTQTGSTEKVALTLAPLTGAML